jgi:hypothetical protein
LVGGRDERRNANHFALDSLVFEQIHLRATPQTVLLWKKFSTRVKATQCLRRAALSAIIGNVFLRAQKT